MAILPFHLTEVPHHRWDAATQCFIAEIKTDGVIVQKYSIPRAVFFSIHADMARAIKDSCEQEAKLADVVPLKRRRKKG